MARTLAGLDYRPVAYCPRSTGAPVAQGIEHWFPKPGVAGSNPAGGAGFVAASRNFRIYESTRRLG
jgi:hypothetical protein